MKICRNCNQEFEEKHFNQKMCSDKCRADAQRIAKARYKKTDKGKITEARWVASERRNKNEKCYRAKPRAMRLACERTKRHKTKCPPTEAQIKYYRRNDKEYTRSEIGRTRNKKATAKYRKTDNGKMVARVSKLNRRALGKIDYDAFVCKSESLNWQCAGCGITLNFETVTVDHIQPVSKGGMNDIDNLQPMCRSCNASKGNKWKPPANVDTQ